MHRSFFRALSKCIEEMRGIRVGLGGLSVHDSYRASVAVVECAAARGVRRPVVEALDALVQTSANYGDTYAIEMSPRNLATDIAGNLILLDVLYDRKATPAVFAARSRVANRPR